METMTVTKLECAKRQLECAIRLFFENDDPVSIHTLACAAYQLLFDINTHRGGRPMWVKDRYLKSKPDGTSKLLNEPENFFKHANRDPDGSLEFDPIKTEAYIVDACRTYTELTSDKPLLSDCFRAWFTCHDPVELVFSPGKSHFKDDLVRLHNKNDRHGFVECFMHAMFSCG